MARWGEARVSRPERRGGQDGSEIDIALADMPAIAPSRRLAAHLVGAAYGLRRRRSGLQPRPAVSDAALRDQALARLRETGELEYAGEFGAEVTTFIPFAAWLKSQRHLNGGRIVSYAGMRPYYFFLEDQEFSEKADRRSWLPTADRWWPGNSTYTAWRAPWHAYPDYRARYAGQGRAFARPVLFIQNKFTVEWAKGPINYLPLSALERLLTVHAERFQIVYSRPRDPARIAGYTPDGNSDCDYPDIALVRRFPGVIDLEADCAARGAPYNQTKLEILARSHVFVAVQGGGAHLLAAFSGALMLLLDRESEEYPHAYSHGAYKYLSNPPPVLLLARTWRQLARGLEVLDGVRVDERGPRLTRAAVRGLRSLRI
jgi:hypothetical protein